MKTKHTPGPWDDINLCDLLDKSPEEIEANITLMNAAPELLEACIEFMQRYESDYFCLTSKDGYVQSDWIIKLNKAIKKATS